VLELFCLRREQETDAGGQQDKDDDQAWGEEESLPLTPDLQSGGLAAGLQIQPEASQDKGSREQVQKGKPPKHAKPSGCFAATHAPTCSDGRRGVQSKGSTPICEGKQPRKCAK
jgi:hypothetical protein